MLQTMAFAVSAVMATAEATGLFVSLATFQSLDSAQGPTGNPAGTYTNVAGLVNIPCMDAPLRDGVITALENKSLQEIESKGLRHMALNGYYPAVLSGWPDGWRCIVDGLVYDIFGAEADSQTTQTRVKLQLVTVAQ